MTLRGSEHVLTLPYAGLRGLGPLHLRGEPGQSTRHRANTPPAPTMSQRTTTEGLLEGIVARYDVQRFVPRVQALVTEGRFEHIVRVTHLALQLAEANGFTQEELHQVALAALLHDAARDLEGAELMQLAPPQLELERRHSLALHGRAGRALAESWGVTDPVVLAAVEGHVFGVPPTHRVGMAVYVADVSEEGRGVNERIRQLARSDLAAAYRLAVIAKVAYLQRCGKEIHPHTLRTYEVMVGQATQVAAEAHEAAHGAAPTPEDGA